MDGSKVALITGCSSGIGRDLAQRMCAAGYAVVATARRVESLEGIDAKLKLPLDVTSEESAQAAVAAVLERFGRIDVLVNNAGFSAMAAIEELSDDAYRSMFEVNVLGVVRMLRAVGPTMRAQGSGTIVNISSLVGLMSMPVNGGYSSTKYAVEALSDAARQELGPFGVRVVVVEPGAILTRFSGAMDDRSSAVIDDAASPYARLYARNKALQRQMGADSAQPEAVSRVVMRAIASKRPKARYAAAIPLLAQVLARLHPAVRDPLWANALAKTGA